MVLLIVGRTGAGKDHLAKDLTENGFHGVKSYTTRPKRFPEEDTHIFITKEEAAAIPEEEKAAKTIIGEYEYFATFDQVKNADYYVIDPKGITTLLQSMNDTEYRIVYVTANKNTRKMRAVERSDRTVEEEIKIFEQREKDEDEQFTDFENSYHSIFGEYAFTLHNEYNEDDSPELKALSADMYNSILNDLIYILNKKNRKQ